MLEAVEYHSAFIFKYSERRNTIASRKYRDDVPDAVKAVRVTQLVELQREISARKNRAVIGQTVPVLVEGGAKKTSSQWMGRTDSNVTVVWDKATAPAARGQLLLIRISDASATTLFGEPVA
jgi:tRNA-2-methylthio-N6-dimethylallyladenosine synthase